MKKLILTLIFCALLTSNSFGAVTNAGDGLNLPFPKEVIQEKLFLVMDKYLDRKNLSEIFTSIRRDIHLEPVCVILSKSKRQARCSKTRYIVNEIFLLRKDGSVVELKLCKITISSSKKLNPQSLETHTRNHLILHHCRVGKFDGPKLAIHQAIVWEE